MPPIRNAREAAQGPPINEPENLANEVQQLARAQRRERLDPEQQQMAGEHQRAEINAALPFVDAFYHQIIGYRDRQTTDRLANSRNSLQTLITNLRGVSVEVNRQLIKLNDFVASSGIIGTQDEDKYLVMVEFTRTVLNGYLNDRYPTETPMLDQTRRGREVQQNLVDTFILQLQNED